ncbi:MAG: hypothetical protein L0H53_03220 [Candidatus Nitrosocosmicus sp.]|nr:hypothetical protein [Candidatus Nitrosocosmicus sp.]MDN5866637.1 hypothetical protein [Candidatus Nitrosocosmicus sp.]
MTKLYLIMFASDRDSERATSIEDYQNTCTEFIQDISKDYRDWVERYQLPKDQEDQRNKEIDDIVKKTNEWIFKFGNTIKKIDIIMNDGINKMAETTAGYPFQIDVSSSSQKRYIIHEKKSIKLNLRSYPRQMRRVRVCNYDKDNIFLLSSSNKLDIKYSKTSFEPSDLLDEFIVINPIQFDNDEVISITIKVEELENEVVKESRGYTTLLITR